MSEKKIVGITGAGGNIGSTLRKGLSEKYDLRLFDKVKIDTNEGEIFTQADFSEPESIDGLFNELDALIHLAGDPRPNAPKESTMKNNFMSTSYIFEEARKAGVKKIVFASSNFYHEMAIGEAMRKKDGKLITLDMPPSPYTLYGKSKVFGEQVGLHFSFFGINFAALRIGWTIPGDDPRPYWNQYMRAMYLSHRDLNHAFECAIELDKSFAVGFAISNNQHKVFDLDETREIFGFNPQDNAENFKPL